MSTYIRGLVGLCGVILTAAATVATAGLMAQHNHGTNTHSQIGAPICRGSADASGSAFYTEMEGVNARMHADMDVARSGDVDRDFARMMIPHHQGAIDMARVLLKYGHDVRLKRLAQSLIVEQSQEIAYMQILLDPPPSQPSSPANPTDGSSR